MGTGESARPRRQRAVRSRQNCARVAGGNYLVPMRQGLVKWRGPSQGRAGTFREGNGGFMLESRGLILRPWADRLAVDPDRLGQRAEHCRTRAIHDADSGEALGFARCQPAQTSRWWRWLRRPVLAVYETEDAALLCTARQRW